MNKHLTEQQLIDYQFKLADAAGLNQARTHLGECEQCRRKLEKLARKFAALDLLRGEVKVPEDLLSRTVEQIVQASSQQGDLAVPGPGTGRGRGGCHRGRRTASGLQ